jgi:hypothetical protein
MAEGARTDFEERIRQALTEFPGAIPTEELGSGLRRELVRFEDASDIPHQVWGPQANPPSDYADGVPFVAYAKTLVVHRSGPPSITMVIWSDLLPTDRVLDDVVAASLRDGWTTAERRARTVPVTGPGHLLIRGEEARLIWSLNVKGRVEVCLMQVPRTRKAV